VTDSSRQLAEQLQKRFGETLLANIDAVGEVTIEVAGDDLIEVATALRDEPAFSFEILRYCWMSAVLIMRTMARMNGRLKKQRPRASAGALQLRPLAA
jgi:hypothetical protein